MRRLVYSVAASLDGFIAGPNGEFDWIPMDPDIDFQELFGRFDTLLMGRKSFAALPPEQQFPGMAMYVVSQTMKQTEHPDASIVSGRLAETVKALKEKHGKDIWLFGGGSLFRSLAEEGLVDEVEVAVVPILLGEGIPLIEAGSQQFQLKLRDQKAYPRTGIVLMSYEIAPRT